jgi:hypothetical protein
LDTTELHQETVGQVNNTGKDAVPKFALFAVRDIEDGEHSHFLLQLMTQCAYFTSTAR